jgi:peptidyl-tRNA hydrolase, PTH1 family
MKLLVGLGNPGPEYARNRHNIGFMALDAVASAYSFGPWKRRFQGETCEGLIGGDKVVALKPLTYMNLSGQSVGEAARFLKIDPRDIVVIHDELDLPPAKLRTKIGGGHGGHNGLKSIDAHLGTKDYVRVRLGIGHPGDKDLVADYVLHDFGKGDLAWVHDMVDAIADNLGTLLKGDEAGFMNKIVRTLEPPKPKEK